MRIASLAAAFIAAATMGGCSKGAEREYALPSSLCGVTVKSDLLAPFLPPGKKVSTRHESPNGGTERCKVSVDGKIAIIAGQIWWEREGTVADVAGVHARVNPGHITDDEKYIYSGTGAVGKAEGCTDSAHPDQALFTVMQVYASGRADAAAMKSLIVDYTRRVQKKNSCA
jgi:hypothetical protein